MREAVFRDRTTAGRSLAEEVTTLLEAHPELDDPVVLALPRGGVPVAAEVAKVLKAPLDLVMVRKIGVPWQPELAAGAVVNGDAPEVVLNTEIVRAAHMTEADIDAEKARHLKEIARRREVYLGNRATVEIAGRDAIVVDDGIATGATTEAALRAVRRRVPRSLTLAVPVAPADTLSRLSREVDHLICLSTPSPFYAIGLYYRDFEQVADDDVVRLLDEAQRLPGTAPP